MGSEGYQSAFSVRGGGEGRYPFTHPPTVRFPEKFPNIQNQVCFKALEKHIACGKFSSNIKNLIVDEHSREGGSLHQRISPMTNLTG